MCPSYQAGAIDKKDDWSWAEDPQCRRGENTGLVLAWEKEEGVTGQARQLQHPYLQGRAAVSAMHFKAYTHQGWK